MQENTDAESADPKKPLATGQLTDAERVDLAGFVPRELDKTGERLHLNIAQRSRDAAFFRSIGEAGDGQWLRWDVEMRTRSSNLDHDAELRHPYGWYITGSQANSLVTFLDRLRVEQSDASLRLNWWENNNNQIVERSEFDNESLIFRYETESGRGNELTLHNYHKNDRQMMAKFLSDKPEKC